MIKKLLNSKSSLKKTCPDILDRINSFEKIKQNPLKVSNTITAPVSTTAKTNHVDPLEDKNTMKKMLAGVDKIGILQKSSMATKARVAEATSDKRCR